MTALNKITLVFRDPALEADYAARSFPRIRSQGRIAIILGMALYLLYATLDQWLVPPEHQARVWLIRFAALALTTVVLVVSFTPYFERRCRLLLAAVGLNAGIGILGMLTQMPQASVAHYYPGLVLVTFFTYNFVGTRFIYAVCVDIALIVGYNLILATMDAPLYFSASHNFFIISANLIGGTAGYLQEYQHRQLFLRERTLEAERQEHLERSLHDRLTGLPNRELLHDRIAQAIAHAQRDDTTHAAYFVDLDNFKRLNDEAGHQLGDAVLKEVAAHLKAAMRDTDTVARLGGDEFFVLAFGIRTQTDATSHANALIHAVKSANRKIQEKIPVSASIGICLIPYPGATVADVIRRADHAMYLAKQAGKDQCAIA